MKEQYIGIWTMMRLAVLVTMSLAGIGVCAFAQGGAAKTTVGVGKPYASRDPRPCGDFTGSALTQQKALNSFVCSEELVWGRELRLIENASLQIGNARAYNYKEDYNVPNIDATARVYPIRGSFKKYNCVAFSDYMKNKGRNCSIAEPLRANIAETPSMPIISEQGGRKIQHGEEETFSGSPCGFARRGTKRSRA